MSNLSKNTTDLQAILDAVNALPDAGGGSGGGGSVETCDVTVSLLEGQIRSYAYTGLVDGELVTVHQGRAFGSTVTLTNVVVGSLFSCVSMDASVIGFEVSNGTTIQTLMFEMDMMGMLYGVAGTT